MRFPRRRCFSCVLALVVFLGTIFIANGQQLENEASSSNESLLAPSTRTPFQLDALTTKSELNTKKNIAEVLLTNNSTRNVATMNNNKVLKKIRRRRRKYRRKIKGMSTKATTAPSIAPSVQNTTVTTAATITSRKRKRKNKRRKNRKLRRKKKKEHNNILEVTTAREGLHPSNIKSNSTIGELIRKLNDNPEDNFENFRLRHQNVTLILNELNGQNVGNLVAPVPASAQHFPFLLNNNITLHVSVDNSTKHKTPSKRYSRCRKNNGGCAHYCNPKGKIKCSCIRGFLLAPDQKTCLDIDECKMNNGGCEKRCINTLGSFECRCLPGLRLGDDGKSCQDVNECLSRNGHGPCQDMCQNYHGSYKCSCARLNGTKLGEDGHSCVDLDECAKDNAGCSHSCINTMGNVYCACPSGMALSSDWKTCQDVNECEHDDVKKTCKSCVNTEGSYRCADFPGYQNDQTSPSVVCKPLYPPSKGFISCSRDGASRSYSKTGRRRTMNSPGTTCWLVCPTGYRMEGHFGVTCGHNGHWEGNRNASCLHAEPPKLECPPSQYHTLPRDAKFMVVTIPSPKANVDREYLQSYPSWAKRPFTFLTEGQYDIYFTAKDPITKLTASCIFKIYVNWPKEESKKP